MLSEEKDSGEIIIPMCDKITLRNFCLTRPELLVVHAVKHFLLYSTFSNYFETIFKCAIKQGISTAKPLGLQIQMRTITAHNSYTNLQ